MKSSARLKATSPVPQNYPPHARAAPAPRRAPTRHPARRARAGRSPGHRERSQGQDSRPAPGSVAPPPRVQCRNAPSTRRACRGRSPGQRGRLAVQTSRRVLGSVAPPPSANAPFSSPRVSRTFARPMRAAVSVASSLSSGKAAPPPHTAPTRHLDRPACRGRSPGQMRAAVSVASS